MDKVKDFLESIVAILVLNLIPTVAVYATCAFLIHRTVVLAEAGEWVPVYIVGGLALYMVFGVFKTWIIQINELREGK